MHPRYLSSTIIFHFKSLTKFQLRSTHLLGCFRTLTKDTTTEAPLNAYDDDHLYVDLPKPAKSKSERKPYPTPMKILVKKAKEEREARKAQPCKLLEHLPENGLLVPELVSVAHQVYQARELLLLGLSKLVKTIPVLRCRILNYSMHPRYLSSTIIFHFKSLTKFQLRSTHLLGCFRTLTKDTTTEAPLNAYDDDHLYVDLPKPAKSKSERKPYPTPMKILVKKAKEEREARKAQPCKLLEHLPENGLLVPELVSVAHQVYQARELLLLGLSKLVKTIPVLRCRHCFEVHIDQVGHEIRTCSGSKSGLRNATHVWRKGRVHDVIYFPKCFHLYDRVGKPRIVHNESRTVKKLPAIVEICIQAGLNLENYPTKRRTRPVYSIEGRIVDFELDSNETIETDYSLDFSLKNEMQTNLDLRDLSTMTLDSWFEMISGVKKIMEKYTVNTCGYCPEIQVGPKGHKVRNCKASKHQSRNGMHAWQEATVFDLVGSNYVWHVSDPFGGIPLANDLKRFYGKAPAVVEMCVQAGAPVPDQYRSMMRLDVVPPCRDELDLVT